MRIGRRMVVLLVSGMGKGCGSPKCLRTYMGQILNPTWLKVRILGLIMNRKNLLQLNIQTSSCVYGWKPMLRQGEIFVCAMCCVYLHGILSWKKRNKTKKTSLRTSPKCWCVPIMVMLWNGFGDDIAVDTGCFRMLWWHLNTIHAKNIGWMWCELWCMWYWYVIEKKGTSG